MSTNLLVLADHLSDDDLLARLGALATRELSTTAELVAHLASLESRPSAYAAKGCRRFPVILVLLGSGAVTLTALRMLGRHLTPTITRVVERAKGCTVSQ